MGKIMASGDLQSRLTDLWTEFEEDEYLFEQWSNAHCSADPDPDMSSFDIFQNGFELGVMAAGRDVTFAELEGTVYFFFGTEEEVLARLDGLAASARRDLLAETVHEICEEAKSAGATSVRVAAMSSFEEDADQAEFEKVHYGDNLAPAVMEWLDKVAPEDKVLKRFEALRNGEVLFKKEVE